MEELQNLFAAADALNQRELAERTLALIQRINSQEFTNIAVTGARNSGKTTFINEAVGSEVWEPGALDEDEKPLRISFEPLPEDDRFNCISAENSSWQTLKAIIYELRGKNLFDDGVLIEEMHALDMVFFIISATSPFGKEDVDALKALAPLKRQVVVNGMHLVDEANHEKVSNYIAKVSSSLGLSTAIIFEQGEIFGEIVRNLIPPPAEWQETRKNKCVLLLKKMFDTLEEIARNELETLETNTRESNSLSLKSNKLQSGCYTLRMDVEDYRKAAIESVTGRLSSRRESLVNEILEEAKRSKDKDRLQSAAEERYRALSKAAVAALQEIFLDDLRKVNSSARLLGVPQWRTDTPEQLEKFSPQNILSQISLGELTVNSSANSGSATTLLAGTGAVAGGFALAPLPAMVSVAGTVAALGYGLFSYMKDKKLQNRAKENALDDAIRKAIENIKDFVREIAAVSYGKISEQILLGENDLAAPPSVKDNPRLAQINDVLNTLTQLRAKLAS